MTTTTPDTLGVWEFTPTNVEHLYTGFSYTHEGLRSTGAHRAEQAFCKAFQWDELPEHVADVAWDCTPATNEWRNADGTQAYFVTVYDVGQGFGGHEEGGWWFECGTPIEHYVCATLEAAHAKRDELEEGEYAETGKRYSVLGGDDYRVIVGVRPGTEYPTERPFYE